jgi:hypothetical protein
MADREDAGISRLAPVITGRFPAKTDKSHRSGRDQENPIGTSHILENISCREKGVIFFSDGD